LVLSSLGLLIAKVGLSCALTPQPKPNFHRNHDQQQWIRLPHVDAAHTQLGRRQILNGGAAAASLFIPQQQASAKTPLSTNEQSRTVVSIDEHPAIPVWPTWAGGRVVPVSLTEYGRLSDPYLLLAHHKHWFDPRDPLRKPFQKFGQITGLPYIDVEGFSMHPHRGFDILTYILDGSDGFRHRDSLGETTCTYRGGTAQWMRCGSGVLHEEFWETKQDRRTDIELFQIWINLPKTQKMDKPAILYVGKDTDHSWLEEETEGGEVRVRDVGATLNKAINSDSNVKSRPTINIQHATFQPGAKWKVHVPHKQSALLYVRRGIAAFPNTLSTITALQTATFAADGDFIDVWNVSKQNDLDVLLLTGDPLQESIAMGGPIVMNTSKEIQDAYQQLSEGNFLDRDTVLQQHALNRPK